MKRYKVIYSNFPLGISPKPGVSQRQRCMDAIHALIADASTPEARKQWHEAVRATKARRAQEEAALDAGESTV